jgi:5-formyltetrahydrofolate cyclo-ligase
MNSTALKTELRRQLRQAAQQIDAAEQARLSSDARTWLREQPVWKEARSVLLYAAVRGEIDLTPLMEEALAAGKTVLLPRFAAEMGAYEIFQITRLPHDCAPGKFNILEPGAHCAAWPLNRLDLVVAPGLGFDATGHRLGRGKGFYDRLLAQIEAPKCGAAFDQQIVGEIPAEPHDIHMNFILTPTRWISFPR